MNLSLLMMEMIDAWFSPILKRVSLASTGRIDNIVP